MRRQFGKTIVEIARKDPKVLLIIGDVFQNMEQFQKEFPERILNAGICEQTMVGMASGLALEGWIPVLYSLTPFIIERAFEQVKMDINVMKTRVLLVTYDSYPTSGPTQTPLDPQTTMSVFKNIQSFFPKDSQETEQMLWAAYNSGGPAFVRLVRDHGV